MIDVENAVFTILADAVEREFPGARCVSEITDAPAVFPTVSVQETDNAVYRKTLDGTQTEHHALTVFDVNVFSNQEKAGKGQCRAILQLIDREMMAHGFTRMAYGFMRNADTRIARATARYQGVVSEEFRVYRK